MMKTPEQYKRRNRMWLWISLAFAVLMFLPGILMEIIHLSPPASAVAVAERFEPQIGGQAHIKRTMYVPREDAETNLAEALSANDTASLHLLLARRKAAVVSVGAKVLVLDRFFTGFNGIPRFKVRVLDGISEGWRGMVPQNDLEP
jgi:hypothetical protein